jgi:hypothetical protein
LLAPGIPVIEVDVELPLQPDGNVQVYDVAFGTSAILYVCSVPWHTGVFPVIVPGVPGFALEVTISVLGSLEPQEFFAETEIVPPVDPALEEMDVEVEIPLHPDGIDHV